MRGDRRFKRAFTRLEEQGMLSGGRMNRRVRRALAHQKIACTEEVTGTNGKTGEKWSRACGRRTMAKNYDDHIRREHPHLMEGSDAAAPEALENLEAGEVNTV